MKKKVYRKYSQKEMNEKKFSFSQNDLIKTLKSTVSTIFLLGLGYLVAVVNIQRECTASVERYFWSDGACNITLAGYSDIVGVGFFLIMFFAFSKIVIMRLEVKEEAV